ncbi:iron complex transport system permease protein [Tamaricihabitans halophyticus]|uniref:Iron complex transport system permease protein n=1 Tax=Tamaricihabitans halophyticus TaxID=1262583 RepID=A0A4R2QXR2_9PSEU|nr:iron ABC transporter permease [Tamaricihabitans halophyticus]TCP54982.1 iron complex transport system permease protein [Tamaricihabitans halophyticus]
MRAAAPEPATRLPLRLAWLVGCAVAVFGCVVLSIAIGSEQLAISDAIRVLFQPDGSNAAVIVHELRLPRTLLGVAVGLALGMAGAIMQSITRNPLADPGILGVNAGAATGVVVASTILGLGAFTSYVWFAFLGAGAATVLVYLIGSRDVGGADPVRLALAGTAVSAALAAVNQTLVLLDPQAYEEYRFWVVGDLAGRDGAVLGYLVPFIAIGLLLAVSLGPALNALALGEDTGRALGTRIARTRGLAAISVLLLAGAATAAAGPIAFVGLAVPHLARLLIGPDQRYQLPYSALFGAILVVLADVLGRLIAPEGELQVGIVAAFVGAPIFVLLVRRARIAKL